MRRGNREELSRHGVGQPCTELPYGRSYMHEHGITYHM